MSDKELLDSDEQEGMCPSYFWYFVGSFIYTVLIIAVLIAYLIMYSNHFMWALRRNPKPSLKKKGKVGKGGANNAESVMKGASQMDDVSQQASPQKEAQKDLGVPDVTA